MSKITLYHNPRCSKSRGACQILDGSKTDFEIVHYLQTPPTPKELKALSQKLKLPPTDFIRSKEKRFKELQLSLRDERSDEEWFTLMAENPILIERPIAVRENRAVIARPPERILDLL